MYKDYRKIIRKNTKTQVIIQKNGKSSCRLMLSVNNKRKREEIIANHFLKFYKANYGIKLPCKLADRDKPFDFRYADGNAEFLLEIVAISDDSQGFNKQSNQYLFEDLTKNFSNSIIAIVSPKISSKAIRESIKHIDEYPPLSNTSECVSLFFSNPGSKCVIRKLADNKNLKMYITYGTNRPFEKIINDAIKKKEAKMYENVSQITLIVDNQIIEDCINGISLSKWRKLVKDSQSSPFKEIFLYNGYYSQDDSNGAKFDFYPIKCKCDKKIDKLTNPITFWKIRLAIIINSIINKVNNLINKVSYAMDFVKGKAK